ncbi:MAG: TonB family protein [Saprospiraceae bacterium]|nr:TonB family protein [Saprospiraceae bacterium]
MITWILQSSLCWLFFLLIYRTFLQKETFFRFNRYYLIGTLLLGAIIPLIRLIWDQWTMQDKDLPVYAAFQGTARILEFQFNSPTGLSAIDWFAILSLIYWAGVVVSFGLLAKECIGILRLIRTCPKKRMGDYIQVATDFEHLPFSFLRFIFISDKVKFKDKELNRILRHETSHVTDWHTLDVLLVELISVMAWCSPMVYWYKKSIRNTHEYLADALVTRSNDKNSYGRLLIDHSQRGLHMALANHFIYSQLKNRINMMMKSRSRPVQAWKYTLIIPMLFILGLLFAYKSDVMYHSDPTLDLIHPEEIGSDSVYTEVDVMPGFPGCKHLRSEAEQSDCSLQNMITYLSKTTRYPGSARQLGIQGTALISFVVNTDGSLTEFELLKDPGQGTGSEALRVVKGMNELPERWTPGEVNGKAVRVKMTLPVKFKLDIPLKPVSGSEKINFSGQAIYILNGDRVTLDEIQNILPDQITSIHVLKDQKAIDQYGPEGNLGVIEILTKPNYFVNGEESTKELVDKIPLDQITTMDVVKYGKKETGIVNIRTTVDPDPALNEKTLKMLGDEKRLLVLDNSPIKLETLLTIASKIKSMHQLEVEEAITKYGEVGKYGAMEFSTETEWAERKVFQEVDESPQFPGCEALTNPVEKQTCTNEKLIQYLYSRILYPKTAKENGIEGRVVVSFVVTEEGKLLDVKLVNDIGGGCGEEALRVVNSMQEMDQRWIPGKKNGLAVATEFKLPLHFRLQPAAKAQSSENPGQQSFSKVENSPVRLIPNPSSHQVEVVWDKSGSVLVEIYDITGKRMHTSKWAAFNGRQVIDIKTFSPGTYIVKVFQGRLSQEQKLIIQ